MDDLTLLVLIGPLIVGLICITGFLLKQFSSFQRAVGDIGTHVNTVTDPALATLAGVVNQMNLEVSKFSPSVQTLGQWATGLQQASSGLQQQVQVVSSEVAKVAEYGKRYDDVEKEVRNIHSVLVGSYSKGRAGEETLELAMALLSKIGRIKAKVPLGGGIVEYAAVLDDGKVLPIDSKVVAAKEVASLNDEQTSSQARSELERDIKKRVRQKIAEVQKYADPEKTSPFSIMALPDSAMEIVTDLIPEAVSRNIILIGYSGIPQLVPYFIGIYSLYAVAKDVKKLQESVLQIQRDVAALNPEFFANHFEKPLATLIGAVKTAARVVSGISAIAHEVKPPPDYSLDPVTVRSQGTMASNLKG